MLTARKKRIFGPRNNGRRIKLVLSFAFVMSIAAASFSAGYYAGTEEGKRSVLAESNNIAGPFIY